MRGLIKRLVKLTVSAGALLVLAAPALASTTSSFGPQAWYDGTQTGRYRAHVGNHYILLSGCSGRYAVDLRVDVIKPDISEGFYSYACGSTGVVYGKYDSYLVAYRGHFIQSRSDWYGKLSDTHQ